MQAISMGSSSSSARFLRIKSINIMSTADRVPDLNRYCRPWPAFLISGYAFDAGNAAVKTAGWTTPSEDIGITKRLQCGKSTGNADRIKQSKQCIRRTNEIGHRPFDNGFDGKMFQGEHDNRRIQFQPMSIPSPLRYQPSFYIANGFKSKSPRCIALLISHTASELVLGLRMICSHSNTRSNAACDLVATEGSVEAGLWWG